MLQAFADFVPDGALNYAAALAYEDLVAELLDRGAKPETKVNRKFMDHDSQASALVEACTNGHLGIAKQLIDKGADVNAESGESFCDSYALASAARTGNLELVRLLLCHGANVDANGSYGPALQIAAYEGHKEWKFEGGKSAPRKRRRCECPTLHESWRPRHDSCGSLHGAKLRLWLRHY